MPPEIENEVEDMNDVSVQSEIKDEADASKEAEQSVEAESSTAKDDKTAEPADSLSIVRDVVGKKVETAASSADEEKVKESKAQKEPDDENYSDVPFNKHPRFQHLLGRLRAAQPDAQRYQNVQNFLDQQGLGAEEAAELLMIGGLIKTNPAEAWRRMQPTVQKVLQAAGEVLPDDLKTMVQNGEMSREAAMQVSRSRAQVQSLQVSQQFSQQRAQAQASANHQAAVQNAVNAWESERRLRDPNFEAKMPALEREVAYLLRIEGQPTTPEGVRAQLQKAYGAVSASAAPRVPPRPQQKPAIRPVNGGQVNGNVRPKVESALDAVNAVIARRAG